ncbi:MAG TPA: carbamoyltransferase HypF, partial [Vicinamibacterales bacterium]|nr:carbamoyltransferase HypF [Vicinamibacterales bacterium]
RLAAAHGLGGWVLNAPHGVEIHVEGPAAAIDAFAGALRADAPAAARIVSVDVSRARTFGAGSFEIRQSAVHGAPTLEIPPDLPPCEACLAEMVDPQARRFEYPYINCTDCGPRFSVIHALPYDRERTTMASWPLCPACEAEYRDPHDRRFHAEPIACAACGPHYWLTEAGGTRTERAAAIVKAAELLRQGAAVAVKGVGGYHLCCDATNETAVVALRERKYRKAKPFAVMARDVEVAKWLTKLDPAGEALVTSAARPIVLLPARISLPAVAPQHRELGVMLPYAPLHHLLFRAGAPHVLVMTSGNKSNEPLAYEDHDARARLTGIVDAFLAGERPIARRLDDSVVRHDSSGPIMLRRSRGYAPAVVCGLPTARPVLALGPDLKNSVTIAIAGKAVTSQHVGDLEHLSAYDAFQQTVRDFLSVYQVQMTDLVLAHDAHPHYRSTAFALEQAAKSRVAVQHHRAHVASVLAERHAFDTRVVGVAFDGTGYGDDGAIWGSEFFVGSVAHGFRRAASLRPYPLPGGDAAARCPIQAAAGVLSSLDNLPSLTAAPFCFGQRYEHAQQLVATGLRTFTCTSAGRLFDTIAALLGFPAEVIEYEGQAAEWLEQLA